MGKFIATYSTSERVLADGRVMVPGEPVELSDEDLQDEHNKRLIEEGQILEYQEPESEPEPEQQQKSSKKKQQEEGGEQ